MAKQINEKEEWFFEETDKILLSLTIAVSVF